MSCTTRIERQDDGSPSPDVAFDLRHFIDVPERPTVSRWGAMGAQVAFVERATRVVLSRWRPNLIPAGVVPSNAGRL
jgi:hypothetical protein